MLSDNLWKETGTQYEIDWEVVRINAAIAAMQSNMNILAGQAYANIRNIAVASVQMADILVEELKGEKDANS